MEKIPSKFYSILSIFIFLLSLKNDVYRKRKLIRFFIIQWVYVLSVLMIINLIWTNQILMIFNVPIIIFLCLIQMILYSLNNREYNQIKLNLIERYNNNLYFTPDEINFFLSQVKNIESIQFSDFLNQESSIKNTVENIANRVKTTN